MFQALKIKTPPHSENPSQLEHQHQPLQNQQRPSITPAQNPGHSRSQSNPYFQHTRSFNFDQATTTYKGNLEPTVTCHVSATPQLKPGPARLQRHVRSQTAHTIPRLPFVTTDIKIETTAAAIPSSIFSGGSPIKFDLSPPESPALSPEKERDRWSFIPSFRADKNSIERSPSPLRLSTWFQGESAPLTVGIAQSPTREQTSSFPTMPCEAIPEPLKPTRPNSFLSSFFTTKTTTVVSMPQESQYDEFFNLDIKRALQPGGPSDPFSPSSFKNLQQNAEGLLARMQIAYRQKSLAVHEVQAEQEAQEEELEEAQTRTQHLKLQLDTLSSRLDEQNNEMQRLMHELQEERRLRQEETDRNRTVRIVDDDKPFERRTRSRASLGSTVSMPSMLSDADSCPSEMSDPFRHDDSSAVATPYTPRSIEWPQEQQFTIPMKHDLTPTLRPQDDDDLLRENAELKTRVGHLEKELDSCLEILKGIGL